LSETFLIPRRTEQDMVKMYSGFHVEYALFLSDFNFLGGFSKNNQVSNFMKIRPVGAELFLAGGRADGRTDGRTSMTKLIVAFRNFAKAPENTRVHFDKKRINLQYWKQLVESCVFSPSTVG
jgi:hypothetical protein